MLMQSKQTDILLTHRSLIHRNETQPYSIVDDEVVMLNIKNEEYYYIDRVGSKIWELLKDPIELQDLITNIKDQYDVNDSDYVTDIVEFITELNKFGLVRIINPG